MNKLKLGTMFVIVVSLFSPSALPSSGWALSDSTTLLAFCTPLDPEADPGSIMACSAFISGVVATLKHTEESNFCFSDRTTLDDIVDVVIVRLKQKFTSGASSIPIIIEALTMNWPCKP